LRQFGKTGLNVMTRLMGLLVMVVGTQFVIDGVTVVVRGMR
jgi:small neutral amino acid transporter SnatA (MarC family)